MRPFRFANRRLAGAVAVTGLLLVPLGVFGSSAIARTVSAVGQYGHSSSSQYQYRVTLCHRTGSVNHHPWQLITVSSSAVAAHLQHGDRMPPCPPPPTPSSHHGNSSNAPSSESASNSGGHGNSGDHGNGKDSDHHGKS
jgi:hypothetical protein